MIHARGLLRAVTGPIDLMQLASDLPGSPMQVTASPSSAPARPWTSPRRGTRPSTGSRRCRDYGST
jgi:hypothetical protein